MLDTNETFNSFTVIDLAYINNADNKKKMKSIIIQTTYKLPNKSMKHVHHVAVLCV